MDPRLETLDMRRFRQMYIVVSALPVVLLLLTFVLWFMGAEGWTGEPVDVTRLFLPVFGPVAALSLPLALWLRARMLRAKGPYTGQTSQFAPRQTWSGEDAAVMRITQAAVIGMALPEQSVLLGFVLGFLSQSWSFYVVFAAYTVLGWAIMYPRPSQVREWYAAQLEIQPGMTDRQPGML